MIERIRIGTRKSRLALEQTRLIGEALKKVCPQLSIEEVTRNTLGDLLLESPLQAFGGKGAFVAEFEEALLSGAIDMAVHSAKDVPMELAPGLLLGGISPREDARDVLVTRQGACFHDKNQFVLGTSSPRRQLQAGLLWDELYEKLLLEAGMTPIKKPLQAPVLEFKLLRGNVGSRLEKLAAGEYDGIILAAAGLKRLGIAPGNGFSFSYLDPHRFIPAGGQGIMAVEVKEGSLAQRLCDLIKHEDAVRCLKLEREIVRRLGAGCHEPVGVYSEYKEGRMEVWGICSRDGQVKRIHLEGRADEEGLHCLAYNAWKGLS